LQRLHVDAFKFTPVHREWIAFSQVTAPPQARPPGNLQHYPHVVHRFFGRLHKSSTGLRTERPGCRAPAEKLPAQTIRRSQHGRRESDWSVVTWAWPVRLQLPARSPACHPQLVPRPGSQQANSPASAAVHRGFAASASTMPTLRRYSLRRPVHGMSGLPRGPSAARHRPAIQARPPLVRPTISTPHSCANYWTQKSALTRSSTRRRATTTIASLLLALSRTWHCPDRQPADIESGYGL